MPTYLDRYIAGEHKQVWAELVAFGPAVRDEPVYADARAVAHETMRRVRHNIETLIPRLVETGFHFLRYGQDIFRDWSPVVAEEVHRTSQVFGLPSPTVRETLARLEWKAGGPLPLSLCAFYEVIGTVNLNGKYPHWRITPESLDALEIHSAEIALEWFDDWGTDDGEYRMSAPISPVQYGKVGVSGSGPYVVVLPDAATDARLHNEGYRTTFVTYLRICFRWAGFPGWERVEPRPDSDLAFLTEGLLPI